MNKLFNFENPFWHIMSVCFDLFMLNVLLIIFSLPIITSGPSMVAFYSTIGNILNNEGSSIIRSFISSFRKNFKRSFKIGLFITFLHLFLITDIYLCYKSGTGIYTFFMFFFFVLLLLILFITPYTYILLSQTDYNSKNSIMWAYILCIKHSGKSFVLFSISIFSLWICRFFPGLIFIIPGSIGLLQMHLLLPAISSYQNNSD